MDWFNNLSLRYKLILLVAPPLIVLQLLFISQVYDNWQQSSEMSEILTQTERIRAISPLVTELQRERGRTALFLAGQGQDNTGLTKQHKQTDQAIQQFENGRVAEQAHELMKPLRNLSQLRRQIQNLQIESAAAVAAYTQMIESLMAHNKAAVQSIRAEESLRKTIVYWAIAELTEVAGKERAMGSNYLRRGTYTTDQLAPVLDMQGQQASLIAMVSAVLHENELSFWQQMLKSKEAQVVDQLRQQLLEPQTAQNVTPAEWFDRTTERIDSVVKTQQEILHEIVTGSSLAKTSAQRRFFYTLLLMLIILGMGVSVASLLVKKLNAQTRSLQHAISMGMKNKDLRVVIEVGSNDEVGRIANYMNQFFDVLSNMLNQLGLASTRLAESTSRNSSAAYQNTHHIEQQQNQVHQVATASEEMSATAAQISEHVTEVADAAQNVRVKSEGGEQHVRASVEQVRLLAGSVEGVDQLMQALLERSNSMIQVIDVIRNLADQTNLLALNAAIEAARAGDHGRGFAVVADEVRQLAQQTHTSTQEIQDIIQGFTELSQTAANSMQESHQVSTETLRLANELEQIFGDILADVQLISDMSTEIATASEQQVAVSKEVAQSIDAISQDAHQSLLGAREIQSVAREQDQLAGELSELATSYQTRRP